jgi:hypothetical protein
MVTRLELLRDLSAEFGFVRQIEQDPAGYDCPSHETPVIEHRVETIGGWQAIEVCPAFDGSCGYDPNAQPMQIEPPESDDGKAKATPSQPRNSGGF